ncbi:MAG: hypothetical protein EXR70_23105 [Deltaproteobacteria bacterium]|nr:hypothetical protein [Deltaproteobacteria bacterium]
MMKHISTAMLAAGLVISLAQPVWARTCPKLIKEGRDLLVKTKLVKTEKDKVKALIDESERLHDGGDHGESMKKVKEALTLLKKK